MSLINLVIKDFLLALLNLVEYLVMISFLFSFLISFLISFFLSQASKMFNTLYRQERVINLNYLILRKSRLLMIKVDQLHHQAYTRILCYFLVKISLYSKDCNNL